MDLASVVAALASVGVQVSGSTPNSSVQVDSSRACPTGLAGPEPSGTINDPGQHFQIRRIQGFVGASEQLCAEVHHGLDGLSEEKEHFFGCQGSVGPFGGCSSTVMDHPWHFCLFLCLGDG